MKLKAGHFAEKWHWLNWRTKSFAILTLPAEINCGAKGKMFSFLGIISAIFGALVVGPAQTR
jgi:hypothetical protein